MDRAVAGARPRRTAAAGFSFTEDESASLRYAGGARDADDTVVGGAPVSRPAPPNSLADGAVSAQGGADEEGSGPLLMFSYRLWGVIDAPSFAAAASYKAQQLGIGGTLAFGEGEAATDGLREAFGVAQGKLDQAQEFQEWLCAVGSPGSVVHGAVIDGRQRGDKRLFAHFTCQG